MEKDYDNFSEKELEERAEELGEKIGLLEEEVQKGIIGQKDVVRKTLICAVADGNALIEGVPGLGKSLLIEILGRTIEGSEFNRIQFTPDLLPADIMGIEAYNEEQGFYTEKGPVFANFILADEINRAPPKVQSAMLQAMQENQVSIGDETYDLPSPFFVMATQNPVEQGGTYPLPEAQVDRFLFKIYIDYPKKENEEVIIDMNADIKGMDEFNIDVVMENEELLDIQEFTKNVIVSDEIKKYIVDLVAATRNPDEFGLEYSEYIEYGGSPRASINLALAGRAHALMEGRHYVTPEDIREVITEVFQHRILLNYEGEAKDIETTEIIDDIVDRVPVR